MLHSAIEKKLDVHIGNGNSFLRQVQEGSVSLLTAFHVLEHLHFEEILDFFEQSRRVLAPGGVMILETPNPENLHVITSNFYLDPTHIRPIPILLMISLAKYFGYTNYSVIRLQEQKDLYKKEKITFHDLFYGVSKDYGLIAQSPGGEHDLVSALDHPLQYETGIGIDEMIKRLDERMDTMEQKIEKNSAANK